MTVRRWLAVVATFGMLLAAAVWLNRPPWVTSGPGVLWSDGSVTQDAGPTPVGFRPFGPLLRVEWSDASTSWCYRHGLATLKLAAEGLGDKRKAWENLRA
jgi:hypothetical protein